MRAADINLAAMLDFIPAEGRVLLNGQRMMLFSQAALGILDSLLVEHLGHEFADALFAQFGYRSGHDDFATLDTAAPWDSDTERIQAGPVIHQWEGIVAVELSALDYDRATGAFHMAGTWRNSYQAENHLATYGAADHPVCTALTGYASGWASAFLGAPLLAIETACLGMGDPHCAFEIRPESAWDGRADRWRDLLGATSDSVAAALEGVVRRRTRQLEEARAAAERANRTKSQFLANISHELRTPMNGVIGVAQLLRDTACDARQLELVDLIIESGNQQVAIISDLLDYSKIESGQMSIERRTFDLARMLGNLAATFAAQAATRRVGLSVQTAPDLPQSVISDSVKVNQVLFNLVGNAIKFTPEGGTVTLSVTARELDPVRASRMGAGAGAALELVFEIRDTGIGMTPDQLARLFTPFMQADATVTRRFGGTGLGLVISKELAELLGGRLRVTSELGVGSAFLVELPVRTASPSMAETVRADPETPAAPGPASIVEAREEPAGAARILVAEDNRINALVVRRMLQGMGAAVQMVGDGAQALAAWESGDFDLVLLDLHMPELDGMSAVRILRAREATSRRPRVPVVALTADAFDETRLACLEAGFDSFLTKPLDRADLARLVAAPHAVVADLSTG